MAALTVPLPPRVERAVQNNGQARESAVDEAVRILRSGDSLWPVNTGRSKRAFRRIGRGASSQVYNPVNYSSFVEDQQNRPAARTLARHESRLLRAARRGDRATDRQRETASRTDILGAAARRTLAEDEAGLYRLFLLNRRRFESPGQVRIPAALRLVEERVRRLANRNSPRL